MDKAAIVYDRNDILGEGTFGYVFSGTFCCENRESPPAVAVKLIQHKYVNTDEREIKALEKLRGHPNIIRLYGVEKDDDYQ